MKKIITHRPHPRAVFSCPKEVMICTILADISAILDLLDRQYSGLIDD
ncbi:hypothetical protein [Ruminococcus sp.]|nr:hypothetical protein [Ruminococcus sp.]MBO5559805.1 hypothetical protein [Ruminococcus sp.]